MSEIVKNELDAIKAFEDNTEKRRSELTLNELNYISDKQLHKKDGGGTGGDVLVVTPNMDTGVLDKTWKEITDSTFAVLKFTEDNITYEICPLLSYDEKAQGVYYNVTFASRGDIFTGSTDNPDGYPVLQ